VKIIAIYANELSHYTTTAEKPILFDYKHQRRQRMHQCDEKATEMHSELIASPFFS
jgi:hypothetical protein